MNKNTVLDGELVVLTDGKPDFYELQKRSLMGDPFKIKLAAKKYSVQYVAYDILYYDGKELTDKPLMERKKILSEKVKEGNGLNISRYIEKKGIAFFELAKKQELEGIVAKKKDGLYHIGKRTYDWVKIKVMQDEDLIVFGYEPDEDGVPKDLILGQYDENGTLQHRGKVYLGVSKAERIKIMNFANENVIKKPWFEIYKNVVWIRPELVGTVQYMQQTKTGGMRQPVWKGLRMD